MKALGQALQTGKATTYEIAEKRPQERPSSNPFKRWLVRLFGKEQGGITYTARSVGDNLMHDYGKTIGQTLMAKVDDRPLSARKVMGLHAKAVRMQHSIDHSNRQHGKHWGDLSRPDSLAAKLFSQCHGFSSTLLPDYEKSRLNQHIEQSIFHHGDHKLTKGEVQALMLAAFHEHRPGFAEVAPETAKVLGTGQLYTDTFDFWQQSQSLSVPTRNLMHAFRYYSSHSARLQWQSPFEQMDKRSWAQQIDKTETHIERLSKTADALLRTDDLPAHVQQAMVLDLQQQVVAAKNHVAYLRALNYADYRQPDNMHKARQGNIDIALLVLDERLAQKSLSSPEKASLQALRDELLEERQQPSSTVDEGIVMMKKAVNAHAKGLRERLAKAGMPTKLMAKSWKKSAMTMANQRPWQTIEKAIPVRTDQGIKLYRGVITPAAQLMLTVPGQAASGQPQGSRDLFSISYEGKGRSSATRKEPVHAINLNRTSLNADDGRVLYKGLRTGTLAPPEPKKGETLNVRKIAENRTMELLQAAFVEKLSTLPEKQQLSILAGEQPLNFDLLSSSMLSPDLLRHKTGVHDDEYSMQGLQRETLTRLCQQPLTLNLTDSSGQAHQVKANIRLATLSIPVNVLGLNPLLSVPGRVWQNSDGENDKGLSVLMGTPALDGEIGGMVGAWLQGEGQASPKQDKVLQLVQQIRMMYAKGDHHQEGFDAYKLIERVQLLGFMIGAVGHFNCKSGKDRTGEADARIRQLASEVDRLGYVPDYNAPATREHREAVQTFLFGAGNTEVQQQNINVPAFKTGTGREELGESLFRVLH